MQTVRIINSGSPDYWRSLQTGYRLIARARKAHARLKSARLYNLEGYDEDGNQIVSENIGPFDAFDDAVAAIEQSDAARSILRAQGVKAIGYRQLQLN